MAGPEVWAELDPLDLEHLHDVLSCESGRGHLGLRPSPSCLHVEESLAQQMEAECQREETQDSGPRSQGARTFSGGAQWS